MWAAWILPKSESFSDHPQRIKRGFKFLDDKSRAKTSCKVIVVVGESMGNGVVRTTYVKNMEVNVIVEHLGHCQN